MKDLGDKVTALTEALGVKACKGCKKRAEALNNLGRRGFLKSMALAGGALKIKMLGAIAPVPDSSIALAIIRVMNTQQVTLFTKNSGKHGTREQLLGPDGLQRVAEVHAHEDTASGVLMRSLNLDSSEPLAGWLFDFASKENGYVLKFTERDGEIRKVYISDHEGVIYRADLASGLAGPRASELPSAKAFPGALPHNIFIGEERATRISKLLTRLGLSTVAYAQMVSCQDCCQSICNGQCVNCQPGGPNCTTKCIFNCGTTNCHWCWFNIGFQECCIACNQCSCPCFVPGPCSNC